MEENSIDYVKYLEKNKKTCYNINYVNLWRYIMEKNLLREGNILLDNSRKENNLGKTLDTENYSIRRTKAQKLNKAKKGKTINYKTTETETIADKVSRLEWFCKTYPEIWRNRHKIQEKLFENIDDEEKKRMLELLNRVRKDYKYIILRKKEGHLPEQYTDRLRAAGAGFYFENMSEMERLSTETGLSMNTLRRISNSYGNMSLFKNAYIEAMINNNISEIEKNLSASIYEKVFPKLIQGFDISQPNFIRENTGENMLILEVMEVERGEIADFSVVRENLLQSLQDNSICKGKIEEVMQNLYGLENRKSLSRTSTSQKMGITTEAVRQIKEKGIVALQNSEITEVYRRSELKGNKRERFIRSFFEKYDIFIKKSPLELDKTFKEKLLRLYNERLDYEPKIRSYGIGKLGLSARAQNGLEALGIKKIGDLLDIKSLIILQEAKNIGTKTVDEIVSKVHLMGLKFKFEQEFEKKIRKQISSEMEKSSLSIENLKISTRLRNILLRNNMTTIGEILKISSKEELKQIKGMGDFTERELIKTIHTLGLTFRFEIEEEKMNEELKALIEELQTVYREKDENRLQQDEEMSL